jgi:hypothetical protein
MEGETGAEEGMGAAAHVEGEMEAEEGVDDMSR